MNRSTKTTLISALIAVAVVSTVAIAGNVTLPHVFQPNTVAKATEVNANFQAVKTASDDNQSQITALTTRVSTAETNVTALTLKACPSGMLKVLGVCVETTRRNTPPASTGYVNAAYDCSNIGRRLCPIDILVSFGSSAASVASWPLATASSANLEVTRENTLVEKLPSGSTFEAGPSVQTNVNGYYRCCVDP